MDVVFGWSLDGHAYPESATGKPASYNSAVVGPIGFLSLLEGRLGFRRPSVPRGLRTSQYLAALSSLDDGAQFYSASLAADAWATAEFLLSLRDELIASGWNKAPIEGVLKICTLAQVELKGPFSDGFGERLGQVNNQLKNFRKQLISNLRLVGSRQSFPQVWRRTIDLLESCGTRIEEIQPLSNNQNNDVGALAKRLERDFRGNEKLSLAGDGSFCVIDADDELQAAIFTSAWLTEQARENIVIIRGDDCSALSQACKRMGLPSPGNSKRLQCGAISQTLPLAFEMVCRPIDPKKIVELLCLPGGPIPNWIARRLLEALGEAPGVGGPPWQDAWTSCVDQQRGYFLNDQPELSASDAAKQALEEVDRWRNWFAEAMGTSGGEISKEDADAVCDRVEKWAALRGRMDKNADQYNLLLGRTKLLRQIILACHRGAIPLIQLRKMIETVNSYGASLSPTDAAEWATVNVPGQIWDDAHTIVWWGFAQLQWPLVRNSAWSETEMEVLHKHGVVLEKPLEKLRRESRLSHMPFTNCRQRLLLVRPRTIGGVPAITHPIWDEIVSVLDADSLNLITVTASDLFAGKEVAAAGLTIKSSQRPNVVLPKKLRSWTLSPNTVRIRTKESYSSIEKLLGCPLAWTLAYSAGMWEPKYLGLREKQLLLGILAHAAVKEIYDEQKKWQPDSARDRAVDIVRRLLPEMAAGLLLPGASQQLREATQAIPSSIYRLTEFLNDADVTVVGCEQSLSAKLNANTTIAGVVDMLVRLPSGEPAVLDFKWSSAPYFYRKRLSEGRALQLAIYSWLARQDATAGGRVVHLNPFPAAGYFMFRQCELFFTAEGIFPRHTLVRKMAHQLDETWKLTIEAYEREIAKLAQGDCVATGVSDDSVSLDAFMHPILVEPPCDFCNFGHFCGKRELS